MPLIADVVQTRTQRDWLAALEPAGVPCGPINRLDQVFADPQVVARRMRLDLPHPLAGTAPQVAAPIRYSRTAVDYGDAPPLLGQHTAAVLRERLGFDDAAIGALAQRGVIGVLR